MSQLTKDELDFLFSKKGKPKLKHPFLAFIKELFQDSFFIKILILFLFLELLRTL